MALVLSTRAHRALAFAVCASLIFLLKGNSADAGTIPAACSVHAPWGAPEWKASDLTLTLLCRPGYVAIHDDKKLVPDYVAWILTADKALGCLPRKDAFAPDPDLPQGQRAELADYKGHAGYDRGHFAPNSDFAWDADVQRQSFYLSNMSPQASHLNQWQWENLEAATRAWALSRQTVIVMDGPIWTKSPRTIGDDHVAIPKAYWKVIVDPGTNEAQAFIMNNEPTPKGDLAPFMVTLADVEKASGITLPLPAGISKSKSVELWPIDTANFTKTKKKKCQAG
jgi:endonuclease G